jgi:hypothetical protein
MNPQLMEWLFVGGGVLAIGGGIKWLWDAFFSRLDKREKDIETREHELEQKEAKRVQVLSERVATLEKIVESQGEELRRVHLALGILVAKEARREPGSEELKQVTQVLINGKVEPIGS